jgi:ribosomal protein L32
VIDERMIEASRAAKREIREAFHRKWGAFLKCPTCGASWCPERMPGYHTGQCQPCGKVLVWHRYSPPPEGA